MPPDRPSAVRLRVVVAAQHDFVDFEFELVLASAGELLLQLLIALGAVVALLVGGGFEHGVAFAAPDFIHYPSHTREVGRQVAVALGT